MTLRQAPGYLPHEIRATGTLQGPSVDPAPEERKLRHFRQDHGLAATIPLIISASGIRGIVGRSMTTEVAARFGAAFGRFLVAAGDAVDGCYVVVGRDSRTSGEALADAASEGLRAAGVAVRRAGVAPTPTVLLAVQDDDRAVGGLVVTASHNPVEWNGLKLAAADGAFLSPAGGRAVQDLYASGPTHAPGEALADSKSLEGVVDHHIERILALTVLDPEAVRARRPLVALDCVHGAGGTLLPELLRRLGCRLEEIGTDPDGRFPRDPEPVPANLAALGELVRSSGAEIGMAVDPDGDRLALVDERGRPIGEDWTLALAAEYVLERRRGPLVTNLSSSQCIEDVASAAGAPFLQAPVGEARVAERMVEAGAVIGGEGNGGVILPELHLTRDAAVAAALVLNLLAARGTSLGGWLEGRRQYHMVKRKVPMEGLAPLDVYRRVRSVVPAGYSVNSDDGLRLSWRTDRAWLHVRPSGTEPVLRVIAETPDAERSAALADLACSAWRDKD